MIAAALDVVALVLAVAAAACARRSCHWLDRVRDTAPDTVPEPTVSLLVPARNEAGNVGTCVAGLIAQDLPDVEVLLLDDASDDDTAALARAAFAAAPDRFRWRVVGGDGPPPGWIGKTWACEQLATLAHGEWLFFLDADTRLAPEGARRAVAAARATGADVVSFLPRYRGAHWVNRLVVPWLYHFLVALVPLPEVTRWLHPRLAIANGQALLVQRAAYERLGGHAAVRADVVEDVSLAIAAKRRGLRVALADGSAWLECVMYRDAGDAARGFLRNFQAAARLHPAQWLALLTALALVGLWPWGRLGSTPVGAVTLLLTTLTFGALVWRFRQHVAAVACWPLTLAALLAVASCGGALALLRQPVRWRGRRIGLATALVTTAAATGPLLGLALAAGNAMTPSLVADRSATTSPDIGSPRIEGATPATVPAPLAGLALADQSGRTWTLDELDGTPVVIVVGDRGTSDDATRWGERLGRARPSRFAPWRTPGAVTLLSVARLPDVPSFARPAVLALLPGPPVEPRPSSPLLLDWGGRLTARLALPDDAAAVVILGPRHDERARATGPSDDAAVARLVAALDAVTEGP